MSRSLDSLYTVRVGFYTEYKPSNQQNSCSHELVHELLDASPNVGHKRSKEMKASEF